KPPETSVGSPSYSTACAARVVLLPCEGLRKPAPTRFDKLFSGVASPRPALITPGGTAGRENIGPNEGFEDYGRLLERAIARIEAASRPAVNGWRARRESNPRPTGSKPVALSS